MHVYIQQIYANSESHRVGATPEEALVPAFAFGNKSKQQQHSDL